MIFRDAVFGPVTAEEEFYEGAANVCVRVGSEEQRGQRSQAFDRGDEGRDLPDFQNSEDLSLRYVLGALFTHF